MYELKAPRKSPWSSWSLAASIWFWAILIAERAEAPRASLCTVSLALVLISWTDISSLKRAKPYCEARVIVRRRRLKRDRRLYALATVVPDPPVAEELLATPGMRTVRERIRVRDCLTKGRSTAQVEHDHRLVISYSLRLRQTATATVLQRDSILVTSWPCRFTPSARSTLGFPQQPSNLRSPVSIVVNFM